MSYNLSAETFGENETVKHSTYTLHILLLSVYHNDQVRFEHNVSITVGKLFECVMHLISVRVRTFDVMYDHTLSSVCKSPNQPKYNVQSAWWYDCSITYLPDQVPRLPVFHLLKRGPCIPRQKQQKTIAKSFIASECTKMWECIQNISIARRNKKINLTTFIVLYFLFSGTNVNFIPDIWIFELLRSSSFLL